MTELDTIYRRMRPYTMVPHPQFVSSLQLAKRAAEVPGDIVECLPGGALVSLPAGRTVCAMRRFYSGPMIEITTAGGDQLAATPNHPILTRGGWVPAGLIQEGGYIVSRTGLERMGVSHPHVDDMPTPISEVFEALQRRRDERGSLQSVDLDIGVLRGEVQVVTADMPLALSGMAPAGKPFRQQNFASTHLGSVSFSGSGSGDQCRFTLGKPSLGLRTEGQGCLDEVRLALYAPNHGIAPRMFGVSSTADSFGDRPTAASILGSEDTDSLASEIAPDRIVSVRTFPYSDHVFNLQTTTGWYNADNIIVHNCGTWRGGMIAGIATLLGNDRTYWLYDSWEGLPPATEKDGYGDDDGGISAIEWQKLPHGNCTAPEYLAKEAMELSGVTDYHLVKGWFEDTLPSATFPDGIALLRLDADWHSSTTTILEHLFPKVNVGGFLVVDDYFAWSGCAQAVHEYLVRHDRQERITTEGRWWLKEGVAFMQKR